MSEISLRSFLGPALAAVGTAVWLALAAGWFRGVRSVPVLREAEREPLGVYPSISVIVPARNEEEAVEEALGSVLTQEYPGRLEVVVVDDRSTDGTPEVLAGLASRWPERLRVVRVEELPHGWLGKNHALYVGAAEASGEWLLFTDADVRFSAGCLVNAVGYAVRGGLDHLTLAPEIVSRGVALKSFVATFVLVFEVTQRPWRASDPRASEAVGVGAFNLMTREAYLAAGTHRAIRLRPDDDMRLGRLVKEAGFRQRVAYGTGSVSVEWHRTLAGVVRGLEKSMFPSMDYRVSTALLASIALLLTNVLPYAGIFLARRRVTRLLFGANPLVLLAMYLYGAERSGGRISPMYAALHPFGASAFIYAMLRSTYRILANGGVEWRGTYYPLEVLRERA
ncbi:MAG TPA: glycosyltransferase [Rubrobacteraceae bacterium]|nr:glycosyltransferase [Rubrobacteraceae bacterium]